jgi:outer membrane protein OmpA-like peptidoglycan-associated protein
MAKVGAPDLPELFELSTLEAKERLMRKSTISIVIASVAIVLVLAPGCVTKKQFRSNVEDTDTRVGAVETAVEANERRIGDLRDETDSKLAALEKDTQKAQEVGSTALNRAEKAEATAVRAEKGRLIWTETLSDDRVKFSFGQASVPEEAAAVLDDLAQRIKSYGKALYLEIEGHTDNTGSEEYNITLGENRAMAVRNYMHMKHGIPLHAMSTISYGESRTVADNGTSQGRAQNRRVVIRVFE